MKKLLFTLFCFLSLSGFSQLKYSIVGGYYGSGFTMTGSNQSYYSLPKISSFSAGLSAETTFDSTYSVSFGLSYFQKGGSRIKTIQASYGPSTTTKINYLQIPLDINYKKRLNKQGLNFLLSGGFYFAVGLSGTDKGTDYEITTQTTTIDNKVHFTTDGTYYNNNETPIKPVDFGYHFSTGLEWKALQLRFDYSHGFTNIEPVGTTKIYNQTIGATLGIRISK